VKTPKHSLRKVVSFLNNPDEDGGFWLPNIQRPFVWGEDQICRLFDSILREYPISTLLVWKTRSTIRRRKFIDNFHPALHTRLSDFYVPEDDKKKCLVLDGQQRLQSLYIGLCGSYDGNELHLDILSGEVAAPDDVKYKFAFLDAAAAKFPWVKFKDLVFSTKTSLGVAQQIIRHAGRELTEPEQDKVSEHVALVFKTFHSDDGVAYQELDSIENKDLYTEDDVVEIFIRANSGGTRLGKSDLLFSLLTASWDYAGEEMEELLGQLAHAGFSFPRDFVLKTCLTLLDQGARYDVDKFRKPGVREEIEAQWDRISKASIHFLYTDDGRVQRWSPDHSFGWDPSRILVQLMGGQTRPEPVRGKLDQLFKEISAEHVAKANRLLEELEKTLGPNDPDLTRAKSMLSFLGGTS
jgi:hypothetical protein